MPVKFWQCVGDPVVSFDVTQRFVNEIRENGGVAYLRAFPYGGHEPQLVGKPIARPSGNTVVDGKTLQILPAVEKAFVWMRNFD